MGYDATTFLVVGCKVTGKLFVKGETPASCSRKPSGRFCSECGRPREYHKPTPKWDPIAPLAESHARGCDNDGAHSLAGTDLRVVLDYGGYSEEESQAWAGFVYPSDNMTPTEVRLPDLPFGYREKIKSQLEPLGLWDEQSFGTWAVALVSY